ncbi:MAG: HAMP domain-containing sensor histidine kinase [Candidatus Limivivens sp.]|nr:HAMP domain-containing sensor histidine kinase [Candidatus Limivivens sp.]
MKKKAPKYHCPLALLVSLLFFIHIAIAAVLTIVILSLLAHFDVIELTDGRFKSRDLFYFIPIISAVIGFLITSLTNRISLEPFNRLIDHLNRLARGEFKTRIKFRRPISNLAVFQEIENSFNTAAEELEHTEMLRNDFINNFSHEFKTPIVSIAGFAKLLRHGYLSEEQKEEYLAIIEEESLRLSSLATNMCSLTKVENQTILTDISEINLSEQIRSAVLLLAEKWMQKDLNLDIEFNEYLIEANEELLKQVWINLIDNAVKFSAPCGTVIFNISEAMDHIGVAITNFGTEIPEESLDRIFRKFYQADESHSSQGNGIGLAVAKKIVELHHGEISVISKFGATTFAVTLPKKQP